MNLLMKTLLLPTWENTLTVNSPIHNLKKHTIYQDRVSDKTIHIDIVSGGQSDKITTWRFINPSWSPRAVNCIKLEIIEVSKLLWISLS